MVAVAARQNPEDREEFSLTVLTSTGLQKWQLVLDDVDKFFYEADVTSLAREAVWSVWPGRSGGTAGASAILRLWLIDLAILGDGQCEVLVAASSQHDASSSASVQYALVQFRTLTNASPIQHSGVYLLPQLSYCLSHGSEPRPYKVTSGDFLNLSSDFLDDLIHFITTTEYNFCSLSSNFFFIIR